MLDGGPQTVDALAISAQGGFDAYQPLPTLPANSSLILQLQLAQ
jgi:hypothetical protein